jgi:hypothetical protein
MKELLEDQDFEHFRKTIHNIELQPADMFLSAMTMFEKNIVPKKFVRAFINGLMTGIIMAHISDMEVVTKFLNGDYYE